MTLWRQFKADRRGTTAVIFGLSVLPVMGLAGAAVDYGRATSARTAMQKAVDGAALALVPHAGKENGVYKLSDAQLTARGQAVFDHLFTAGGGVAANPITVTREGKVLKVAANGAVPTAIMGVLGHREVKIGTSSEVSWSGKKIELALVLDNTGSMGSDNKLQELKKASHNLLNALQGAAGEAGDIKVAVVPFNTQVNVGSSFRSWVRFDAKAKVAFTKPATTQTWRGCVADREEPYDVSDAAPDTLNPKSQYLAIECLKERSWMPAVAEMRPLTESFAGLRTTIDAMNADGWTNITVGVAHGLAALSPAEPYTGATPFGAPDVEKIMIVLTDGDNTRNRKGTNAGDAIDARTRLACEAVKNPSKKIRLYTIRVINGNAGLLRDCASTGQDGKPLYYDVKDASQLTPVFREITDQILGTRLTS